MKNKKRIFCFKAVALLMIAFIVVMNVLAMILPDSDYSATENRNLAKKPAFSLTAFLSGRYEDGFDSYMADQFPLRVTWMRMMSLADRLFGKTESQGVYLGNNGYLIRGFTVPTAESYLATVRAVQSFSAEYPQLKSTMLLAPTAVTVYSDKLPSFAPRGEESAFIDHVSTDVESIGIDFIDVRDAFSEADEQLYYRTDHHWTTHGAYLAYRQLASSLGLSGGDIEYSPVLVTDSFSGTLTASSGFRMDETDPLYVYMPTEEECKYTVEYSEEGKTASFWYEPDSLDIRDNYTVFFGGNHAQIRIRTDNENARVLLVFKDSYANCFIPFLIPDYQEVIVIDPRYYLDDLKTLIGAEQVTEVLYLYNATTFATDTSLRRVLSE